MQQAAGDGQFLLHAAGQFTGQRIPLVRNFKLFQQDAADAFVIGNLVDSRDEIQVLPDGEIIKQTRFIGKKRELFLGGNGIVNNVMTVNAHGAVAGRDNAGEAPQGGGLAGAVRDRRGPALRRAGGKR